MVKNPLFIRGANDKFFSIDDKPAIPGSTMRGLIGNILNIVSYAEFNQINDNNLYKRSSLMSDKNDVYSGFLKFEEGHYKIYRCNYKQTPSSNLKWTEYNYVFDNNSCMYSTGKCPKSSIVWQFDTPNNVRGEPIPKKII